MAAIKTTGRVLEDGGVSFDYASLGIEIVTRFVHLLEGVIIIAAGILVIRFLRRYFRKIEVAHENQRMALNLLEKITSGFLIVVTATLALKVIGLDLTLLISAVTLGLSFGLKDIIKNYVSGVLILFKSPFTIGDIVKIKSYIGRVEKIDFQSTTLKTFDKKEVTVYNKDVLTQSIVNFSKEDLRRIEIGVTLGHGTDVKRALLIFDSILNGNENIQKNPHYSVVFNKFSADGIKLMLRFWVKKPINILKIRSEMALQIQEAFDEAELFSPYSRTVQFGQDIGMTESRKGRLQAFYSQPALAAIAAQTNGALNLAITAVPEEQLIDKEEPEVE